MKDDLIALSGPEGVWVKVLAVLIAWLAPSLELIALVYFLITIDWLLDLWRWRTLKGGKDDLWKKVNNPTAVKFIAYSALALSVHAVQTHLVKGVFDMYKFVMVIPIAAELLSIGKVVEEATGINIVNRIQGAIDSFIGIKGKRIKDQ